MIVTIDSNKYNLPPLIAEKLTTPVVRWCEKFNSCYDVDSKNLWPMPSSSSTKLQMFFHTPVSMSSDVTDYNFPESSIHFVYLDYGTNTSALKRILKNIKSLKNVVIISNGDVYAGTAQYTIYKGNCSDDDISDVISGIIVVHLKENRTIHEKEVIAVLCGDTCELTNDEKMNQKKYDAYNILDSKRLNYGEIADCYECKN